MPYKDRDKRLDLVRRRRHAKPETFLIYNAKARAKDRGLEFNITKDDIFIPEFCPILGIRLQVNDGIADRDSSPSLDRVDSSSGYIKGNIRVISWLANKYKSNLSIEHIKKLYEYITDAGY